MASRVLPNNLHPASQPVTHKAAAGQRNYTAKQKGDLPPHAKTSSKISGPSTNGSTTHCQKWHAILAPKCHFGTIFPKIEISTPFLTV